MLAYAFPSDVKTRESYLLYDAADKGRLLERLLASELGRLHLSSFRRRVLIAIGVLTAVQFMHYGLKDKEISPSFHCDIKSANVIISSNLRPLLLDCGVATLARYDRDDGTSSPTRGTLGYLCPEYGDGGVSFGSACDIYSFGVVLTELYTGRLQNQKDASGKSFNFSKKYVRGKPGEKRNLKLDIDPFVERGEEIGDDQVAESMARYSDLALACMAPEIEDRPPGDEVLSELAAILAACGGCEVWKGIREARCRLESRDERCSLCRTISIAPTSRLCDLCLYLDEAHRKESIMPSAFNISRLRPIIKGEDVQECDKSKVLMVIPPLMWPCRRASSLNLIDLPAGNTMVKETIESTIEKHPHFTPRQWIKAAFDELSENRHLEFLSYLHDGRTKGQLLADASWKKRELQIFRLTDSEDRRILEAWMQPLVKSIAKSSFDNKKPSPSRLNMPGPSTLAFEIDEDFGEPARPKTSGSESSPKRRRLDSGVNSLDVVCSRYISTESATVDTLLSGDLESSDVESCLNRLEDSQLRDHDRETWSLKLALACNRKVTAAVDLRRDKRRVFRFLEDFVERCTRNLPRDQRGNTECIRAIRELLKDSNRMNHQVLRMFAVCLPLDYAGTLVSSVDVESNSLGRHWFAEAHAEKMFKAGAISKTCRFSINPLYQLLADALEVNEVNYEGLAKFLKPTLSPMLVYTPPDNLSRNDMVRSVPSRIVKLCGLSAPVARCVYSMRLDGMSAGYESRRGLSTMPRRRLALRKGQSATKEEKHPHPSSVTLAVAPNFDADEIMSVEKRDASQSSGPKQVGTFDSSHLRDADVLLGRGGKRRKSRCMSSLFGIS
jgi:serine/threonine protein kinase